MKLYQHILWTGLFCWLLAACGSQGDSNRTNPVQPAVGGDESEQQTDSLQTSDEPSLADSHDCWIKQLHLENYFYTDYDTTANILNVVNMFQFTEITSQEVMDDLALFNYAVVPDSLLQLFQVYQRNDSLKIPNFVTADLMAQLSHIYENYVLRTVEERFFIPMLTEVCMALHGASLEQANKATQENMKDMAAYNAAYFSVAYNLLTGKSLKIPSDYQAIVEEELAYIAQQENRRSALLDRRTNFDYSVFKPYGHYTRTALLRRYFKAWKWLQLASYRGDDKTQQQRAVLLALALQTAKSKSGATVLDVYANLSGAMEWFIGQPASTSVLDIALLLKKERVTTIAAALDAKLLAKVNGKNGIYFFPQPVDAEEAANGDVSSYNKRLECIHAIQQKPQHSPVFAKKQTWNRKKLETASAMRVKLNHNVLIYGVVPDHSDPLPASLPVDTLTPEPLTPGYVEPVLPFWTKLREWVELTDNTLKNFRLSTDTLTVFTKRIHRYVAILENASLKQQNNKHLSDDEYCFIAHIGDSIRQFTLAMIEPVIDRWDWAAGTDRSVAVFKKANQPNMAENLTDSIRYQAVGNINSIYVIVEIDASLYLTKGAAFSYHEFFMPRDKDLKDVDWEEISSRRKSSIHVR